MTDEILDPEHRVLLTREELDRHRLDDLTEYSNPAALKRPISRRTFLGATGGAAAALILSGKLGLLSVREAEAALTSTAGTLSLTEASMIQLALSPAGDAIALNLLGMLWVLPAEGGEAKRLTDVYSDVAYPHWSPRGDSIVFQSYVGQGEDHGTYHVWTMRPDGSDLRQRTFGGWDDREPVYSPDGSQVAFASDRENAGQQRGSQGYDIFVLEVASGDVRRLTEAALNRSHYQPAWSPDGSEIAFVESGGDVRQIMAVSSSGGSPRVLYSHSSGSLYSPTWSPGGDKVAYVWQGGPPPPDHHPEDPEVPRLVVNAEPVTQDEDVFTFPAQWLDDDTLLYAADGQIRKRSLSTSGVEFVPFLATLDFERSSYEPKRHDFQSRRPQTVKGIANPVLSPDGSTVAFVALNQLWTMKMGKKPVQVTDDVYYKATPFWSPDGNLLAYSTDKDGPEAIYIRDMETDDERKLTGPFDLAQVRGAWSPDGSTIAFVSSTNGSGDSYVYLADVATGEITELLEPHFEPGRPTWGPDSNVVALAVWEPYSNRFREGQSLILTVDITTGERTLHNPYPFSTISNRKGDLGPVWSPDGSYMAYVLEDQLYVLPVNERGEPVGGQRRVTDEVADMVSWSGDSSSLLYISNGTLRTVSLSGGQPATVPLDLTWQQDVPTGVHVIHAGSLWDGINEDLHRDVDITIARNRIVDIRPHTPNRDYGGNVNFIDASELTVMPGLWESHGHEQMDQPYVGGRKGRHMLSMGTTTVMGMGDPAYESLEQVESEKSNARLLPRFFWAPEAVDGERMNYDFMRATVTDESLERQFNRMKALDADIVKIYVRLQMDWQERTIEAGHAMGIPSFSHYTYPAMEFGQDCCSHWATQRLGYHLTMSAASIAYEDTIDLYAQSKYGLTITRGRGAMLRTFPNFLEDPRMRYLLTSWQYSQMQGQHSQTDSEAALASTRAFVGAHRRILRAGGIVLGGTDEPLGLNIWGLQATIAGLVHYGDFTEYEALRTVTALPAKVMGLEGEIGTVERGALADLLFIDGNPLERIQDLFNIEMVMKNGRLHTIDDLIGPYGRAEPTGSARQDAPTVALVAAAPRSGASRRRPLGAVSWSEDGTVDYGVDEHC